jgi:hypothetical protein
MDRHTVSPDLGHEAVSYMASDAAVLIGDPLAIEPGPFDESVSCHFPAAESGRAVRALISSLLL